MKVLIVDDDVVSRMMLMHMVDTALAGRGEVLEAEDGEEAWQLLEGGVPPAMLFCDLRMPRLSGMELLARVKADARLADLPVVLVSAAADAASMEQAMGLGAEGYIVKPFDAGQVNAHLARLAQPGMSDQLDEAPGETLRRLGTDAARLLLYLGGLQRQLDVARADIAPLLAAGQPDAARAQLARLGEGCATLGLFAAAGAIAAQARLPAPDLEAARRTLAAAHALAQRRREAVRRLVFR
jgi:two-component system chemotaxis response regulator CheY